MYDWEIGDPSVRTWVRLRQTLKALERAIQMQLAGSGATIPQLDILETLAASKAQLSPSEIAMHMFRERQSTSSVLNKMQKSGYITKVRQGRDQREVKIKIQPEGERVMRRAAWATYAYGPMILKSSLCENEMVQLDGLLKKVRDKVLEELGLALQRQPATNHFPPGLG